MVCGEGCGGNLGCGDPTTAIKSHCRGVQILHPILDALGRSQNVRIIAEPDLLRLIIGSRLPAAEKFERWVFEEVLPAIRKTGGYQVGQPETREAGGFSPIVNVPHARGS